MSYIIKEYGQNTRYWVYFWGLVVLFLISNQPRIQNVYLLILPLPNHL